VDRPDQPSLLSGAKNEGCRDEAKGEVGPQLEFFTKATARQAFSSKTEIQKIRSKLQILNPSHSSPFTGLFLSVHNIV
jgi:hypothetical protein